MRIFDDVRYAWRTMRRSPGFSGAAVMMLTLAIGASTSIFSVVHAVLLRQLPYKDPASGAALGHRQYVAERPSIRVALRCARRVTTARRSVSVDAVVWELAATGQILRIDGGQPLS